MTINASPATPVSHPMTTTSLIGPALLRGVLRGAGLVAASAALGAALPASTDALAAGLTQFMLIAAVAGLWATYDGWRRHGRTGAISWGLAAVLFLLFYSLPYAVSAPATEGGWSGLGDYLATSFDSGGFMLGLVAVPALAGLGIGRLLRPTHLVSR